MGPESALAVLRSAIQNEVAGQRFYPDASFTCIDPWAKEVFATLSRAVDRRSTDTDALAFGIHMERQSIDLCRKAALDAQEVGAIQAYQFLVGEETRHLQQLKTEPERLAGMPWS